MRSTYEIETVSWGTSWYYNQITWCGMWKSEELGPWSWATERGKYDGVWSKRRNVDNRSEYMEE